jgi:hypothetical protein
MGIKHRIWLFCFVLLSVSQASLAQTAPNDSIRLGCVSVLGQSYPLVFLPEITVTAQYMNGDDRVRRAKLRNDIFVVYPYALTAATVFRNINTHLDSLDRRRERKQYLKSVDRTLDELFKEPLKSLTIEQGHVLIKLVNRQTGQNCYSIIRELKGGFSAMVWQSVGVFFNNNLRREYDPQDRDREMEGIVTELESSNAYRYALFQQGELMKKITRK